MKGFNIGSAMHKSLNFTGLKTGKIPNLSAIENFSNCHLDGIYSKLKDNVAPGFIIEQGGNAIYKKANSFIDTLKYPFTRMPLELLNAFANKFNIESLQNSKLLTNFNKAGENERYERAMRGLLQTGNNLFNNTLKQEKVKPEDVQNFLCKPTGCENSEFAKHCGEIADKFYEMFDENLSKSKAHYNTPHERTVVKVVSGATAAFILGNDFYNKAILNGKTENEAKISAKDKMEQELIESGQEAIAQYFTLGAFSEFTNNHTLAAPVLNTILSTVFRITSRLAKNKPLKKDYSLLEKAQKPVTVPSMERFLNSVKNKMPVEFEEIKPANTVQNEDNKKHILSLKNIGLACLASVGIGYALKGIRGTKAFEGIKEIVKNSKPAKAIKNAAVGEIWATDKEKRNFINLVKGAEHKKMAQYYQDKIDNKVMENPNLYKDGKIFIGEYEKTLKIPFTKIEVSRRELMQIPLIPFKILVEFASYPYKAAQKIFEGVCGSKKIQTGVEKIKNDKAKNTVKNIVEFFGKKPDKFKLQNDCNLINTFIDYQEQLQKHGGKIDKNFVEFYQKHIDDNWVSTLNKETQSSVNNAAIGKLTSLLGTFASLHFSMADDFNLTAAQTGDRQKAEKDARLRGVNKIIRMTTQIAFMDILNGAFKIPYAQSILGAGVITAACTVLTDSVSRLLSGMPFRKMNKEELEQYNENKKEGVLKGYYEMLDKLTD